MLIPLGILAASGASAGSFDLLETQVLGSSQASVTFSSLGTYASTYKHLQLRIVSRSTWSGAQAGLVMQLNADTAANYSYHGLGGNGSSVSSFAGASQSFMYQGVSAGNGATANAFAGVVIDLLDVFDTNKFKTVRALFGNSTTEVGIHSGSWRNTNALTSILLKTDVTSNLVTGSRFSLFGIKGA